MAHQLELDVIAEGIESKDHLIFLQQNLCNKGQGYLFSEPVPPKDFVHKFYEVERVVNREGISQEASKQKWLEESLESARQELRDTVRQQQGMIFKYKEQDGKYILTLCDGELLYRIGLTPEYLMGKELSDIFVKEDAEKIVQYYRRAWENGENVTYEAQINGIWYLASLRPIRKGGQVCEVIGSCVDISERVKKEQETIFLTKRLAEQEARYRLIADNSDDFIAILDANRKVRYLSPSYERLLGYSLGESGGKIGLQNVHQDDAVRISELYDSIVTSKNIVNAEYRYYKSDGSYIWLEALGKPILSSDGEVEYVLIVSRDISERKEQEEKILQSELRYRQLIELSPEAVVVHVDGRIIYANDAAVDMVMAVSREDLIGRSLLDFMCPSEREELADRIVCTMGKEKDTIDIVEQRCICLNGKEIMVEVTGGRIIYNGTPAVQLFFRDVTLRKEAEQKLRESEAKYRLIAENTQDLIGVVDTSGFVTYASPSHEAVLGFPPERYEGLSALDLVHPDDVLRVEKQFAQMFYSKVPCHVEFRYKHANGYWVYVEVKGTPVQGDSGDVEYFVIVGRDITNRKQPKNSHLKFNERVETKSITAEVVHSIPSPFKSKETGLDTQKRIIQLVEDSKDIVYYFEVQPEFKFRYVSPSLDNYLGSGVVKSSYDNPLVCFERIHPDDYEILSRKVHGDLDFSKPIIERWRNNEQIYLTFEEYANPVYDNEGNLIAVEGIIRNIDDKIRLQQDLEYRVTHDALTGVYSREFYERIVQKYGNEIDTSIGIILCDIDKLKFVNDNFGHKKGDALIKETARVLNNCSDKNVIVARIGGDEFIVLITGEKRVRVEDVLEDISKRILDYNKKSDDIQIKVSKGCAFSEHSIGVMEQLFFEADSNMYLDKNSKRQSVTAR